MASKGVIQNRLSQPLGSKHLSATDHTEVNCTELVAQEDTIITLLEGGDASVAATDVDYKSSMNLEGVTLKKGALIVSPAGEAFQNINISEGSALAYNSVFKGEKPGSFVGLLDDYPDAAAAYSLRKLRADYEGPAIQVRIDTATTPQPSYNIGFDSNGNLDTADLLSKAAGNDAYVSIWYDQSLIGNNATQTTAENQSQIVISGTLVTNPDNGEVAIATSGAFGFMSIAATSAKNIFSVNKVDTQTQINYIALAVSPTVGFFINGSFSGVNGVGLFDSAAYSLSGEDLLTHLSSYYHDGSGYLISDNGSSPVYVGGSNLANINQILGADNGAPLNINGVTQEVIIYSSGDDSNNAAIRANINNYYSIYE